MVRMTDSGPEHNPFAPPDPSAPPPPPPAPYGAPPPYPPPYGQPGPPPDWAHPQLQQPWQQSPWAQQPARTTSAPAVAALVTAVVALVPVALVLSIAALVRMRSRELRGTGLVYAALAVCAGWAFLISLTIVVGVLGGFDAHSRGSVSVLPTQEVGTCLDGGLDVTDCTTAHDLEVYFSPTLPDPVWPGTGDVANAADTLCEEAFEGYVGTSYNSSDLDYDFYAPTESDWDAGKHRIACVITPSGDSLTGSVKGSGR
jgi:hypothetical protein